MRTGKGLAAGLLLAAVGNAHAGRPLVTDDARLLEPRGCQVEAWLRDNDGSREYWAAPACNPWSEGGAELTVAAARTRLDEAGSRTTDVVLQGKTLLRALEPDGWGAGIVGGTARHPHVDGGVRDWYATLIGSRALLGERVAFHANAGWLRDGIDRRDFAIFGLATEAQVHDRLTLVAEAFGRHEGKASWQAGIRFKLADRVSADATVGDRFGASGGDARWFSIGLHVEAGAILP